MSSLLKALVKSRREFQFDDGREVELKGLSGAHSAARPLQPGHMIAVTGGGVYAGDDRSESWRHVTNGLGQGYAVGVHFNPQRGGESLIATGQRPPGLNAHVWHTLDGGDTWEQVLSGPLPRRYDRVSVVLFAKGRAWIASEGGQVYGADEAHGDWSLE